MDNDVASGEATLLRTIESCPIIDNHAHPLLKEAVLDGYDLATISTEAHGDALKASFTTLPHFRAVKHLSAILGCESTWTAVTEAIEDRRQKDYGTWIRRCLSGIECALIDDGLEPQNDMESFGHFGQYTPTSAKRIVRIEHVAADLIDKACMNHNNAKLAWQNFHETFMDALSKAIEDPDVVGFKSVVCYRTGLDVGPATDQDIMSEFEGIYHQRRKNGATTFSRINHKSLNDFLVCLVASTQDAHNAGPKKPIQFHTGLGDNDITLTKASPAHLQEFIKRFPNIPIVLLHSGYPYVREAGYLAAMYSNVYSDIGEVFPMVSRDGQETILRQTLEICPYSKILWSTDGHYFPETFLLAVIQMRETFQAVLCQFVRKGDITYHQAIDMVKSILFTNSNKLYNLKLAMHLSPPERTQTSDIWRAEENSLQRLVDGDASAQFMRICWLDMTATLRTRVIPLRRVKSLLQTEKGCQFGISTAALNVTQFDELAPGVGPAAEWILRPDFASLKPGPRKGYLSTMGSFTEADGSAVTICPRTLLQKALRVAAGQGLSFLLGFEVEFLLLRRGEDGSYDSIHGDGHAWCVSSAMDHDAAMTVVEEAIAKLEAAGVYVELVHPESCPGQYEIVLPKAPALQAVDTLVYAREVISCCANAHGYKMTLHPKPIIDAAGTASHVHMSISSAGGSDPALYEPFYAGILKHLPGILAYTCAHPISYSRVIDGHWAGGTWITWGRQNRETPLRKIEGSHWELKCMDGLANPYLAMSAILLSGVSGVASGEQMRWKDCRHDPSTLSEAERSQLGIDQRLPLSLPEALRALVNDDVLVDMLGKDLTSTFVALKEMEMKHFATLDEPARRRWIISRY